MGDYQKPWLDLDELIQKLSDRGLDVGVKSEAKEHIYRIGYYRLTGYLHPFRTRVETATGREGREDIQSSRYKQGVTLDQIVELVDFDRRLRLLMLDALERIEVSLRMRIGHALGKKSPFAHLESETFEINFVRRYKHGEWVGAARHSHLRSHELFVRHFDEVYEGQLPIWALTELLGLGQLAVLYGGLQREIATEIAGSYGVPTKTLFRSWLASINDVRNLSAHHARLFNRKRIHAPKRPKANMIPELEHLRVPNSSKNGFGLYNVVAIVAYLLRNVEKETQWHRELVDLLDGFPEMKHMGIEAMGFPEEWKSLSLWTNDSR